MSSRIRHLLAALVFAGLVVSQGLLGAAVAAGAKAPSQAPRTEVKSRHALARLLGLHPLRYAGIDWVDFGYARVYEDAGRLVLYGMVRHKGGYDQVRLEGTVSVIHKKHFVFKGWIEFRRSEPIRSKPIRREGESIFRVVARHGCWRLALDPAVGLPVGELRIYYDERGFRRDEPEDSLRRARSDAPMLDSSINGDS